MISKPVNHDVKPNHLVKECATVFDKFYKEKKGLDYIFSPKDFYNLKLLIRKIESVDDSGNTIESLQVFLSAITSNWHLDNLSIPLINSHFNKLYADARSTNISPQESNRITTERFIQKFAALNRR